MRRYKCPKEERKEKYVLLSCFRVAQEGGGRKEEGASCFLFTATGVRETHRVEKSFFIISVKRKKICYLRLV